MLVPSLLLGKPSAASETNDHIENLTKRLALWKGGKTDELISEGQVIQKPLTSRKRKEGDNIERIFEKLMFEGKINAAWRYLTQNNDQGILPSTPETIKKLIKKHPKPGKIYKDALPTELTQKLRSSCLDKIN